MDETRSKTLFEEFIFREIIGLDESAPKDSRELSEEEKLKYFSEKAIRGQIAKSCD